MVSCEGCAGYYEDDTKEDFKKMIAKLKSLEKLQIVRTGDPPTLSRSPLNFRRSDDQYGTALMTRVIDWLEHAGLGNIDVEVVQLVR